MSTQHDLSGNEAKISFDLLVKTAQIAVGAARIECERALGGTQTACFASKYSDLRHHAKNLAYAAENLAVAADTLHVLQESRTRDKFTVLFADRRNKH